MTHEYDTRDDQKLNIPWSIGTQIVFWLVAALVTYGAVNARVAVLEAKQDSYEQRLTDIQRDVRQLNTKLDRVIELELQSK